jgi:hypothetical protein
MKILNVQYQEFTHRHVCIQSRPSTWEFKVLMDEINF